MDTLHLSDHFPESIWQNKISFTTLIFFLILCWNIPCSVLCSPFLEILGDVKLNLCDNEDPRITQTLSIFLRLISASCSGPSWALWTISATHSPFLCSGAWCTGQSGTLTPSIRCRSQLVTQQIIADILMSQADKWTGGNVTMVTSTDSVHLPMVLQVRWWMLSQTICRLYFGSFVRFITPSDSQTFPTSVFLSTVTAAISACPHQVKSGTILLEDIN